MRAVTVKAWSIRYANTPEGEAFFANYVPVDAAIYALNHQADGINAIVVGDVLSSTYYGRRVPGRPVLQRFGSRDCA